MMGRSNSPTRITQPSKVSWLDIELLRSLVADHSCLFATVATDALFRCASYDLFYPRQIRWQFLAARMFARLLER